MNRIVHRLAEQAKYLPDRLYGTHPTKRNTFARRIRERSGYDFGDRVRASASSTAEDDSVAANMHVVLPLFRARVESGVEAGAAPSVIEREHLPFAGKLIAYETGVRFLADYLQGDVYFKVHHPEHNLHRARTQFALVQSIDEQAEAMTRIVREVAERVG